MATSRPGFARRDTGHIDLDDLASSSRPPATNHEFRDQHAKDGATVEVTDHDDDTKKTDHGNYAPPDYADESDGATHITKPVETAKDITTQVIHVEDDPAPVSYTHLRAHETDSYLV